MCSPFDSIIPNLGIYHEDILPTVLKYTCMGLQHCLWLKIIISNGQDRRGVEWDMIYSPSGALYAAMKGMGKVFMNWCGVLSSIQWIKGSTVSFCI